MQTNRTITINFGTRRGGRPAETSREKVRRVRAALAAGRYETPGKLDAAVRGLCAAQFAADAA